MGNADIRVGDLVVHTDAAGAFHAKVRTSGIVHIDGYRAEVVDIAEDDNAEARCDDHSGGTADLVLDGHSPYTVKLEVNQRSW